MTDRRALKKDFSDAAERYDEHAELQRNVREHCIDLGQGWWKKDALLLDLGCGTGALGDEVKKRKLGWRLIGSDIAFGMCREARGKESCIINADAAALPFADAAFDGVFSSLMLQWADDVLKLFREMARVTKPGGHCIISTFTEGTLVELRDAFAAVDSAPHISYFMTPHHLSAYAAHAGFTLLAMEKKKQQEHYPDAKTLMRSLKTIGAGNKQKDRNRGLMTPRQLETVEATYREQNGSKKGLKATWQTAYLLLEKR